MKCGGVGTWQWTIYYLGLGRFVLDESESE